MAFGPSDSELARVEERLGVSEGLQHWYTPWCTETSSPPLCCPFPRYTFEDKWLLRQVRCCSTPGHPRPVPIRPGPCMHACMPRRPLCTHQSASSTTPASPGLVGLYGAQHSWSCHSISTLHAACLHASKGHMHAHCRRCGHEHGHQPYGVCLLCHRQQRGAARPPQGHGEQLSTCCIHICLNCMRTCLRVLHWPDPGHARLLR